MWGSFLTWTPTWFFFFFLGSKESCLKNTLHADSGEGKAPGVWYSIEYVAWSH
jgi:hypothetical protein